VPSSGGIIKELQVLIAFKYTIVGFTAENKYCVAEFNKYLKFFDNTS
jgi:hypothetical protein